MKKSSFALSTVFFLMFLTCACKKTSLTEQPFSKKETEASLQTAMRLAGLQCTAQTEEIDYSIYKMNSDGSRLGDMSPLYDAAAGNFKIYYLKDVWSASGQRHPWHAFTTSNFYSYTQTGQIIGSSSATCAQDNAVGAGSMIKNGSTYYAFYTGHNPNSGSCTNGTKREGIMLATSTSPTSGFVKNTSFITIYTPTGLGYDETDNWRDPFVVRDVANNNWMMLIMARKNHNGAWRGVIAKYTSSNLTTWTYAGVFYDGGRQNFFNMECPEVFQMGSWWYLLFSDQSIADNKKKYVYYRKSASLNGTWAEPTGLDRFDGNAFYAGKTASNGTDRYVFGWCHVLAGHTDAGAWGWGGNLIAHKLYAQANGDLAVAIPHTVKNWLETATYAVVKNSQWGNVTNTVSGTHSYRIISPAANDVANVIFDPVSKPRYMITANVSYTSSSKDFGFMLGACDGYENFYQLRFVPAENKFRFEKKVRSALNAVSDNEIPLALSPGTNYKVQIVVENSVLVVYIDDRIAMTNRIYKATNTHWGVFADNSDATFSNIVVNHPSGQ